jgi:hypothetical protein
MEMSRVLNKLNTTTIPGIIDDPEKYLGSNCKKVIDFWIYCDKLNHEEIENAINNFNGVSKITEKYRNLIHKLQPKRPIWPKDSPHVTDVQHLILHSILYYHAVYRGDFEYVVLMGTFELMIEGELLEKGFQMVYPNLLDLISMKRAAIQNRIVFQEEVLLKANNTMEKLKWSLEQLAQ